MLQRRSLLVGLLIGVLAGCSTSRPERTTSWMQQLNGPSGSDVVHLDVALLEVPLSDVYVSEGLWEVADEQVVPMESKAMLEDNGFRVGQIGGLPPVGLQERLTSERSCVNPRRLQLRSGKATTLALGPTAGRLQFQLRQDGEETPMALEQAQSSLAVVPSLTREGRVRLQFTPQVKHGETSLNFKPASDRSGWTLQEQRPEETFAALRWEVTLSPNEYIVVGAADHPTSLGHQSFIRPNERVPVQRLLVIRAGRLSAATASTLAAEADDDALPIPSTSLACQAAATTARGTSP